MVTLEITQSKLKISDHQLKKGCFRKKRNLAFNSLRMLIERLGVNSERRDF